MKYHNLMAMEIKITLLFILDIL